MIYWGGPASNFLKHRRDGDDHVGAPRDRVNHTRNKTMPNKNLRSPKADHHHPGQEMNDNGQNMLLLLPTYV